MIPSNPSRLEIVRAFLKLGCISFGGPVAHIGYLREEFVRKRQWLDDAAYGDLVALCQFLPGPASSQVVFALGMQRAGWLGGLLASLCFTLPSAALMILFSYGVSALGDLQSAGWLHELKLAAMAIAAFALLHWWKIPPWLVVLLAGSREIWPGGLETFTRNFSSRLVGCGHLPPSCLNCPAASRLASGAKFRKI